MGTFISVVTATGSRTRIWLRSDQFYFYFWIFIRVIFEPNWLYSRQQDLKGSQDQTNLKILKLARNFKIWDGSPSLQSALKQESSCFWRTHPLPEGWSLSIVQRAKMNPSKTWGSQGSSTPVSPRFSYRSQYISFRPKLDHLSFWTAKGVLM